MIIHIIDEHSVRTLDVDNQQSILGALSQLGMTEIESPCGGRGNCQKCQVDILRYGHNHWESVLACQTPVEDELTIHLGKHKKMVILDSPDASISARGKAGLTNRQSGYGIAVDIGTTTLVTLLYDLQTGQQIASASARNNQRVFGADVVSRIQYSNEWGIDPLVKQIRKQLSHMVQQMLDHHQITAADLIYYSVAGNTVMQHYFCGLNPSSIGVSPFIPLSYFGDTAPASQFDMPGPNAQVYLLPAVSGYIGGDITAGILSSGLCDQPECAILIDIGTNGEMALYRDGRIYCCATAAGPAFEGAEITQGLPGISGAVDSLQVKDGRITFTTIEAADPIGICGSGMLDALKVVIETNLIDETGRIQDPDEVDESFRQYLGDVEGEKAIYFNFSPPIYLTQQDIRSLQLAKAAIAAGLALLVKSEKVDYRMIDRLYLAGGFGSKVSLDSLTAIGLLPPEVREKIVVIGNSSVLGASLSLFSDEARNKLQDIRKMCRYIELSGHPEFTNLYIDHMFFGDPDA